MASRNSTPLFAVLIIALVGIAAFLAYNKIQNEKKLRAQTEALLEQEILTNELNTRVERMIGELDAATENNERLNEVVDNQKTEIELQKQKINSLIRNKNDLKKAKEELAQLEARMDSYLTEINKLKAEVSQLSDANAQLNVQNETLNRNIVEIEEEKEGLLVSKGLLEEQNTELSKSNNMLNAKVTKASAIKMSLVDIHGTKLRSNGAYAKTHKASKMTGIQVCMNLQDNALVSEANETFFLRVINPLGETISQNTGQKLLDNDSGADVLYSTSFELDYDGSADECMVWEPTTPFTPGAHTVEMYNKGYLVASQEYIVK